tara:strand:+ start:11976 stop:12479 length:504 start_codon:yes stop_codon:yes gene_type:complete
VIRLAKSDEIDEILQLTRACAQHMIVKGIHQWNEHYPSRAAFLNDIERGELYLYLIDGKISGTIVTSTLMDEEYIPISWLTPKDSRNVYIHRLAVLPAMQGRGIAQELMAFAERQARENSYDSIRLDTFSQNPRNQKFYEQRGYKRLGNIYFPKQSEHPFYCYELVL